MFGTIAVISSVSQFLEISRWFLVEFEIDCVVERLNSFQMEACYETALNDLALVNDPCR